MQGGGGVGVGGEEGGGHFYEKFCHSCPNMYSKKKNFVPEERPHFQWGVFDRKENKDTKAVSLRNISSICTKCIFSS